MPDYRITLPMVKWGVGYANTLRAGYLLDNVTGWDEPRAGSDAVQAPSGVEESWIVGTDYLLAGDLTFIPQSDTTDPVATGWSGATGVRAFLAWGRDKNVLRFYPDATDAATYIECYLVEPMTGEPASEQDGTRRVKLKLRNSTTPFDGY